MNGCKCYYSGMTFCPQHGPAARPVREGAIIAHDLPRGAVNVQQVMSVTGYGVTMRAVDGVTELHPITQHTTLADVLAGWRPATAEEVRRYVMP